MLQPANVATPATAATGLGGHTSVAPAGVVIESVTALALVVTVLPAASWTVTTGCVPNATVLAAPLGWVVNTTLAAGPGVMVKEVLTAGVNVPSVAVSVYVPALSTLQPAKVATPATAVTGLAVQTSVAPAAVV